MRKNGFSLSCLWLGLFAFALLAGLPLPGRAAEGGTRWALLVGIDKYDSDQITPLRYSVRDVKAIAGSLVQHAGFPRDNVVLMTSEDQPGPDRPENTTVIERLEAMAGQVKPEDTFLFYFSGHGFVRDGKTFLATVNARPQNAITLSLSALPLDALQAQMARIPARERVFIFDCCRDDPEKAKGEGDNKLTDTLSRDLQKVAEAAPAAVSGSAVLYACAEGERAYEWPEKGQGIFTYYLLEALSGRAAGPNGQLTAASLCEYVQKNVARCPYLQTLKKQQTPDFVQTGKPNIVLAQVNAGKQGLIVKPDEGKTVNTGTGVDIATVPAGAKILIDGVEQPGKRTPSTLTFELGALQEKTLEIAVELPGYKPELRTVTLKRGELKLLNAIPLTRLGPRPQTLPSPPVRPMNPAPQVGGPVQLFTDASVSGWQATNAQGWSFRSGVLKGVGNRSWLSSRDHHGNFVLSLEYRCEPGGNGGIGLRSRTRDVTTGGIEIQIMDDASITTQPEGWTGSLFGYAAPRFRPAAPARVWHKMVVQVVGSNVRAWLNGQEIQNVDLRQFRQGVGNKPAPASLPAAGYIGLQSWSGTVEYRNVTLQEL